MKTRIIHAQVSDRTGPRFAREADRYLAVLPELKHTPESELEQIVKHLKIGTVVTITIEFDEGAEGPAS